MVSYKSVITALLLIQISIGVVNMTGIFTIHEDVELVDGDTIYKLSEQMNSSANDGSNALDYFATLGSLVYGGLQMAMTFFYMAITGVPTILKIFYVPAALADLLGFAIEALLVLGIAYKLFTR